MLQSIGLDMRGRLWGMLQFNSASSTWGMLQKLALKSSKIRLVYAKHIQCIYKKHGDKEKRFKLHTG